MKGYRPVGRSDPPPRTADEGLSHAIDKIGFGKYQVLVFLTCGGISLSEGSELMTSSAITKFVQSEFELSEIGRALIISVTFVGVFLGSLLIGNFADKVGRRLPLLVSYAGACVFGGLSAAANHLEMLVLLKLLTGVAYGIGIPTIQCLISESVPLKCRSLVQCTIGGMFPLGAAWASIGILVMNPNLETKLWRAQQLWACGPCMLFFLTAVLFAPESPRFLAVNNQDAELKKVLETMKWMNGCSYVDLSSFEVCGRPDSPRRDAHDINGLLCSQTRTAHDIHISLDESGSLLPSPVPAHWASTTAASTDAESDSESIASLESRRIISEEALIGAYKRAQFSQHRTIGSQVFGQRPEEYKLKDRMDILLSQRFKMSFLLLCMGSYLINFTVFGMLDFLPSVFQGLSSNMLHPGTELFLSSMFELPGVFLAVSLVVASPAGHRTCIMYLGAATAMLFLLASPVGRFDPVGVPSIFLSKFVLSALTATFWVYAVEVFPTVCRGTACGLLSSSGRGGSASAPVIFEFVKSRLVTYFPFGPFIGLLAAASAGLALMGAFLPYETKNQPLEDIYEPRPTDKTPLVPASRL